jgi:hypothetical protein
LGDIIRLLKGYIKDSENKEKQEARNLLKHISTMEFVILLNTWERILSSINLASKDLQAVDMDLGKSASEFGRVLNSVQEIRGQWNEILRESAFKFLLLQSRHSCILFYSKENKKSL